MKQNWQTVKFGDVVRLNKDRCQDPQAGGIERYVGLEHITPEDLRIRRWGLVADGTTFTNYFQPGQVLFGKRRAYQRKVAVADFDGVCSGDIYVFEPKDDRLLPELLPFICQTEAFFNHAVVTSAGSLSPRTNWKQLAQYEFALPPLAEQWKFIDLLRKSHCAIDATKVCLEKGEDLLRRFILDEYLFANSHFPHQKTEIAGEVLMGRQKAPKYRMGKNPRPYLRVANIGELELNLETVEEMDFTDREVMKYGLQPGDILLTEGDLISQYNVGRPVIFEGEIEDCCFQNTLLRFRPGPNLTSRYVLLSFEGARLSGVLARVAKTTTVTHLGAKRFSQLEIPIPPIEYQLTRESEFIQLLDCRTHLRARIETNQRLYRCLLNEVLI